MGKKSVSVSSESQLTAPGVRSSRSRRSLFFREQDHADRNERKHRASIDDTHTLEFRRDGVGEVGVPDVAVALSQLHFLHHRLRPRHLAALPAGGRFGLRSANERQSCSTCTATNVKLMERISSSVTSPASRSSESFFKRKTGAGTGPPRRPNPKEGGTARVWSGAATEI
jgi:hypothetical protein